VSAELHDAMNVLDRYFQLSARRSTVAREFAARSRRF
jgi:hypothetical protein